MSKHDEIRKCMEALEATHSKAARLMQKALDAERKAEQEMLKHKLRVAKVLKGYRESYGLTLDQVASRSKYSRSYIHFVETGKRWSPDVIADVLRVFSAIDREEAEDVRSPA